MTRIVYAAFFLTSALLAAPAQADWWKDESGKGRGGPSGWAGRGGEPPHWARGKGVWDGHLKKGRGGPPPWAGHGEPPDWARGKGVWDGHYKPGGRGGPPPWAGSQRHRAERYPYHPPSGPAYEHSPAYPPYGGQHGYWPPSGYHQPIPRW